MKNTNEEKQEELMELAVKIYQDTHSLNQTAVILEREYHMTAAYQKVRRILITAGVYESEISRRIGGMFREGQTTEQIAEALGMSKITVSGYLPYQKGVYGVERMKRRKHTGSGEEDPGAGKPVISDSITLENLWETIVAHQGEIFHTKKNLPFSYTVKGGEMYTDRRERSITRSTFEAAFLKILNSPDTVTGPKSLNVFGAPYVWAVLMGIGGVSQ